jgi:hypothetical protein
MRIHEGTLSSFAYAEQMCALENLRIWEDTDTGAIIGLIHFSASFRAGYLAFYINSATHPVRVKSRGPREVEVRGLRVPIGEAARAMRKDSVVDDTETITESPEVNRVTDGSEQKRARGKGKEKTVEISKKKVISGAKIEFASEMEKREFVALVESVQNHLMELPDLLGVN